MAAASRMVTDQRPACPGGPGVYEVAVMSEADLATLDRGALVALVLKQAAVIEPTNNRAEQSLRPAVIARKVS